MLNIQINNPELEESIKQAYGDDTQSIANAFAEFIKQQRIRQDIAVSIQQLDAGEGMTMVEVMEGIRNEYK